ncbi:MAG: cation-translocating P-type ATPase [Planctomycetota bacterium]|nr:cation-translocating P-type ATPase [Planctomycetota bacterium]
MDDEASEKWLSARLVLCGFFTVIVMMFSLILYSPDIYTEFIAPKDSDDLSYIALNGVIQLLLFAAATPVVIMLGVPLGRNLIQDEFWSRRAVDILVLTGCASAYALSVLTTFWGGEHVYYDTATAVLVLVTLGRSLEMNARRKTASTLSQLTAWLPKTARVLKGETEEECSVEDVQLGQSILLRRGDIAPLDILVIDGQAAVAEAALTGESKSKQKAVGDKVFAGSELQTGVLTGRVEKIVGERRLDCLAGVLEEAGRNPGRRAQLASQLAQVLIAIIPLLAISAGIYWGFREGSFMRGVEVLLSVVLIACPCALGMATPLAIWVGLQRCASGGILLRNGNDLESLASLEKIFLDKTGTLSTGELTFELKQCDGVTEREALEIAKGLAWTSNHWVSRAIARGDSPRAALVDVEEVLGEGLVGFLDGVEYRLGRENYVSGKARGKVKETGKSMLYLSRSQAVIAAWELSESPRPDLKQQLGELKSLGLELEVLTGDSSEATKSFIEAFDLPYQSQLYPEDKHRIVSEESEKRVTAMVGDGLNDALAMTSSHLGIAVSNSVDMTRNLAHAALLKPGLEALPGAVVIAQDVQRQIRWNLFWAFAYNAVALTWAMSGQLRPVWAAFAMVLSSLTVVFSTLSSGGEEAVDSTTDDRL